MCAFEFGGTGDDASGVAEVFGQVSGYRARFLGGFLVCFPQDAVVRKQDQEQRERLRERDGALKLYTDIDRDENWN